MTIVFNILSVLCIATGLLFFLGAAVGIVRFPDFYTRMHAAGKGDTLSTLLIMGGMAFYIIGGAEGPGDFALKALVVAKILGIGAFIMLTSPTSTHALMKAGYEDGIKPLTPDGKEAAEEERSDAP